MKPDISLQLARNGKAFGPRLNSNVGEPTDESTCNSERAVDAPARGLSAMPATSARYSVRTFLDRLPDDYSLEDVLQHFYVAQQVELGLAEANVC